MLSVNDVAQQSGLNIWKVRSLLWRVRSLGLMEPVAEYGQRTWWSKSVLDLIKEIPSVRSLKGIPVRRCARCTVLIFDKIEDAPEQYHRHFFIDHQAYGDYCPECARVVA